MNKSNPKQHIVLGTIIIGIGVLALLDKLNIFPIGQIFNFWPCVFAVIGFFKGMFNVLLTGPGLFP